jgi:predicted ribosome quality control (RQC) complex YloA/Tae2 family protein
MLLRRLGGNFLKLEDFISQIPKEGILHIETADTQNEVKFWFNHRDEYTADITFPSEELLVSCRISSQTSPQDLLKEIAKRKANFLEYDWIIYKDHSELVAENLKLRAKIEELEKENNLLCDEIAKNFLENKKLNEKLKKEIKKLNDEIKTLNNTIEECDELFFLIGDV